mmetsp:Transcript_66700/g.124594  ORF Transcript_66700/g.124594 Transcript_66700/m.124594 type:complete len:207 (-) Transcript_66700:527-1147(-)
MLATELAQGRAVVTAAGAMGSMGAPRCDELRRCVSLERRLRGVAYIRARSRRSALCSSCSSTASLVSSRSLRWRAAARLAVSRRKASTLGMCCSSLSTRCCSSCSKAASLASSRSLTTLRCVAAALLAVSRRKASTWGMACSCLSTFCNSSSLRDASSSWACSNFLRRYCRTLSRARSLESSCPTREPVPPVSAREVGEEITSSYV